jgi:hypothetical protein
VLVLLVWAGAVLAGLLAGGVLGYEVFGHVRRLRRAVAAVDQELRPQVAQLTSQLARSQLARSKPPASAGSHRRGQHRAGIPRPGAR